MVGTVSNCAVATDHGIYAVRLETLVTIYRTAPTGRRKCPFIFRIHYKCDHVFYKTLTSGTSGSLELVLGKWGQELLNSFFGKVTGLVLVDWILAHEISADRAGLIACQDLAVAQRALLNFNLAISFENIKLNVEDYLEQAKIVEEKRELILEILPEPVQNGIGRWQRSERLQSAHPFILQCIKALQKYAESEAYQRLFKSTD